MRRLTLIVAAAGEDFVPLELVGPIAPSTIPSVASSFALPFIFSCIHVTAFSRDPPGCDTCPSSATSFFAISRKAFHVYALSLHILYLQRDESGR